YKCLKQIDLILSCGDLPAEYLTYLVTVFNVPLFYIRGNHDTSFEINPPQGCVDIHGKIVVYNGIRIMGWQGSHWYNGKQLQYTEGQMKKMIFIAKLKIWWNRGVDLIISHAPPKDIHDGKDPCHKGFKCFKDLIFDYSPNYFLHGHIHTSFKNREARKTRINNTDVVNTFGYYVFNYKL
ncbi:MAG: metallophosphoesterase, partial [Desulfobacula sp.]|nr:metallophosphoesterase [Desulfobacula sp.]